MLYTLAQMVDAGWPGHLESFHAGTSGDVCHPERITKPCSFF